jgi:hypothetical protein
VSGTNCPNNFDEQFSKLMQGNDPQCPTFWEHAEVLAELLKPFAVAIKQLEADKPLLSSCVLLVEQLREHVKGWVEKHVGDPDGQRLT